jgi:hypothetical protein
MKTAARASLTAVILASLAFACEESSESPDPTPGGPSAPVPPASGSSGAPGADPEPSCPTTTSGPTFHKYDVGPNEVWTAEAGPHIVEYDVSVRNGATLTIEPCAEVQVAKGKHIQVAYPGTPNTGKLVAKGTAKRPITIKGKDGERWADLNVHAPGSAEFSYVRFEDGGAGDFSEGSTINVLGDGEDGADPALFVDHVTVRGSVGTGAWLQRGATFLPGSRDLVIEGAGTFPLVVSEHALDALPTGTFSGNATDEILVDPEGGRTAGTGFLEDATIHARGVPYRVGRSNNDNLRIGGRPDKKLVTVTIEPGVVMRFAPGSALKVQHFTTNEPSTGVLRAIGTADEPIVFESAKDAPAPGDWIGIWFGGIPRAENAIQHARISHAGGDCGCILNTCSAITEHEGAVIFTAQPASAFIRDTTFSNIAMHAITEGYDGAFVDFRPSNTFTGVAGCAQTRPRESTTTCPLPKPACD